MESYIQMGRDIMWSPVDKWEGTSCGANRKGHPVESCRQMGRDSIWSPVGGWEWISFGILSQMGKGHYLDSCRQMGRGIV